MNRLEFEIQYLRETLNDRYPSNEDQWDERSQDMCIHCASIRGDHYKGTCYGGKQRFETDDLRFQAALAIIKNKLNK